MSISRILAPNGLVSLNSLPTAFLTYTIYNEPVLTSDPIDMTFTAPRNGYYQVQVTFIINTDGNPGTSDANIVLFNLDTNVGVTMTPASLSIGNISSTQVTVLFDAGDNTITFTPAPGFSTGEDGKVVIRVMGVLLNYTE